MTETKDTPEARAERWNTTPRPLLFVRVRLYRGGQAEYIQTLCRDEQESLYEELGQLRSEGKMETDTEIVEIKDNLRFLIGFLKDIDQGLIELVGPDRDPR